MLGIIGSRWGFPLGVQGFSDTNKLISATDKLPLVQLFKCTYIQTIFGKYALSQEYFNKPKMVLSFKPKCMFVIKTF